MLRMMKKFFCLSGDIPLFICSQIGSGTSALEQKIDEMVYKLYGLTEEEIAIVEGKG